MNPPKTDYEYLKHPNTNKITYNPEDTLPIEIGAFGYLSEDVAKRLGFRKMETCGLEACIALVLIDREKKVYNMSHIESTCVDYMDQITYGTQSNYPESVIVHSNKGDKHTLQSVKEFAIKHVDHVEIIQQDTNCGSIGINLNGQLYDPPGIHEILTDKALGIEWVKRQGFKNMNKFFESKKI